MSADVQVNARATHPMPPGRLCCHSRYLAARPASTTHCLSGRTNVAASKLGTEAHLDVDSNAAGSAREHLAASRQQAGLCLVKCIDVCILRALRKMQGTAWATGLSIHSPSSIARFQERVGKHKKVECKGREGLNLKISSAAVSGCF